MNRRPRSAWGVIPATPEQFGATRLGAPLQVWLPAAGQIDLLIISGIHGEEPESTVLISQVLRQFPTIPERCAVVLAANPDGLQLGTRGNAAGVDLNRNFPAANWQANPIPYRWDTDSPRDVQLSPGESPASEPETRAIIGLVERLHPDYIVAVHAPLNCVDDPHSTSLGKWLAEQSGMPLVEDVGYPTPGSFGSWALEREQPLITYELPSASLNSLSGKHLEVFVNLLTLDSIHTI